MLQGKMTYMGITQLVITILLLTPYGQDFTREELSAAAEQIINAITIVTAVLGTIMSFYGRMRIARSRYE